MVKSDAADILESALRLEGQGLLQTKKLIQRSPVTPLQLFESAQSVDPVLLSPGSSVAVLTDPYGQSAISVAGLRPHWNVSGWVADTKTFMNLQNLTTPDNLVFDKKPKNAKVDAILAVSWAHQFFSEKNYHIPDLVQAIEEMLGMLPDNGQLLIQDFALPEQHDKFVVLDIAHGEAAQALFDFSQNARPHAPKALQGFFIESLQAPRAGVQRFRLPMKWAVEFYHRWRLGIAMDVPYELTTLSPDQWRTLIEQCGARVTYQAPHFLSRKEVRELGNDIHFSDELGLSIPLPAAGFTLLVEKISTRSALQFYERRISVDKAQDILISNSKDPAKSGIVETRKHEDDILPWYRDEDGRLHVLIRKDVPRPIINAVPRGTPNLDGRQWAGYLIEPITIPHIDGELKEVHILENLQKIISVPDHAFGRFSLGATYYPAPNYLMQRVRGITLPIAAEAFANGVPPSSEHIVDVLAADVLRAISSGLIPDGKLEILIGTLMGALGEMPDESKPYVDQAETIRTTKFMKDRREAKVPIIVKSGEYLMEYIGDVTAESLRAVRSVFVEDQMTDYGRQIAGYTEQDFIVPNDLSANTAVCIPLVRDPIKGLLLPDAPRQMPVPQRMGHSEPMMMLPSFTLPGSVKTLDQAREFLAKQLGCEMDDLHVMGPSFFVQPQISAERVYPFLLTAPAVALLRTRWHKPANTGLQQGVDRHVDKTAAFIDYKFGRDYGEFYKGFSPELMQSVTQKTPLHAPANSDLALATQIMNRHPSAKPKL